MDRKASRVDWHQALAAYLEPLVVDRRVAIFGDASGGLAARFAELGARSVFVWDPDTQRARREAESAPHGVIVRALLPRTESGYDAGLSRGTFDLALVADVELFDDPEDLLANVRRLVGDQGAAVVAAPNRDQAGDAGPGAFDYYALFDLVAGQFEEVTMIAQLPFHGVALAELGEDDDDPPSVTVDMQLARDRAPEAFIALASQGGVRLDRYAIVELPARGDEEPAPDESARVALEEAQLRAASLEASLAVMRDRASRAADLEAALVERTRQLVALTEEVDRARAATEIERVTSAKLEELALRADRAGAELEEAALRADRAEAQLEAVALRAARADAQLEAVALRAARADAQLEEAALRAARAERALAAVEPELARVADAQGAELARYEEALRDRALAVRTLETELARRERMVRELVGAIDEMSGSSGEESAATPMPDALLRQESSAQVAPVPPASRAVVEDSVAVVEEVRERDNLDEGNLLHEENVRLRGQLDALALDLAHREGAAQAAAWANAELENRLAIAQHAGPAPAPAPARAGEPPPDTQLDGRLASALDELDALRQALAQEHDARVRAESGEELARVRAEVRRQAARLEELGDRPD